MAIVGTAGEMRNSPEGDFELGKWVVTRRFKVLTDDLADGPIVVTGAVGIPLLYQTYQFGVEGYPLMRCRRIHPVRDEQSPFLWIVEATYETAELKGGTAGAGGGGTDDNAGGGTGTEQDTDLENPLLQLAEVETRTDEFEAPLQYVYDLDTQQIVPVKNSAGEVFDPPPNKQDSKLTLTITRNEPLSALHPFLDVYYKDAVNSDAWGWGLQPGQCKIMGITAQRQQRSLPNGTAFVYLRVTYSMQLKPDWDTYILNAGHYYLKQPRSQDPTKNIDAPNVKFLTDDGHPRVGLLAADGTKLPDNAPQVFLRFRPYRRLPFALLNLPTGFSAVQ